MSPVPIFTLHNKSRPSDSLQWMPELRMKTAGFWLLILFSKHEKSLAVLMGIIFKDVEHEQLLLSFVEALCQEYQGRFSINGEMRVPLEVNIYLVSLLGSLVLSSLPSLWHLWDTNSLVCGITSSSKLFLTRYSYSSSMRLTISKLIWVMTNRIRY